MDMKQYDKFEKKTIKEIEKKYKINSYLKVVKHIIRIVVEQLEKLNEGSKK